MNTSRLENESHIPKNHQINALAQFNPRYNRYLWLIIAHVPLAHLLSLSNFFATLHAIFTLIIGLWWAIMGRLERVAYVVSYIAGIAVIWRMTSANVFWEYGKYATILILIVAIFRNTEIKFPKLELLYFLLLIPSTILSFESLYASIGRISFNLSGPLALFICVWFFSSWKPSKSQLSNIYLSLVVGVSGVFVLVLMSILGLEDVEFSFTESSLLTSGGFGPNQVASTLSAGALMLYYIVINRDLNPRYRSIFLFILLGLITQSAFTFSRGGVYSFAISILVSIVFLIRDNRIRSRLFIIFGISLIIGWFLIVPWLDNLTLGTFTERFIDISLTGRGLIIQSDLIIWRNNLLFGVGPGISRIFHAELVREGTIAHTEFSRLLSEHGIFGLGSLGLMVLIAGKSYFRKDNNMSRAILASLITWSFAFLFLNGMRLVIPTFLFGLATSNEINSDSEII